MAPCILCRQPHDIHMHLLKIFDNPADLEAWIAAVPEAAGIRADPKSWLDVMYQFMLNVFGPRLLRHILEITVAKELFPAGWEPDEVSPQVIRNAERTMFAIIGRNFNGNTTFGAIPKRKEFDIFDQERPRQYIEEDMGDMWSLALEVDNIIAWARRSVPNAAIRPFSDIERQRLMRGLLRYQLLCEDFSHGLLNCNKRCVLLKRMEPWELEEVRAVCSAMASRHLEGLGPYIADLETDFVDAILSQKSDISTEAVERGDLVPYHPPYLADTTDHAMDDSSDVVMDDASDGALGDPWDDLWDNGENEPQGDPPATQHLPADQVPGFGCIRRSTDGASVGFVHYEDRANPFRLGFSTIPHYMDWERSILGQKKMAVFLAWSLGHGLRGESLSLQPGPIKDVVADKWLSAARFDLMKWFTKDSCEEDGRLVATLDGGLLTRSVFRKNIADEVQRRQAGTRPAAFEGDTFDAAPKAWVEGDAHLSDALLPFLRNKTAWMLDGAACWGMALWDAERLAHPQFSMEPSYEPRVIQPCGNRESVWDQIKDVWITQQRFAFVATRFDSWLYESDLPDLQLD